MSKCIELNFHLRKVLINKEKISWIEWIQSDDQIFIILHMSSDDKGIPVPENESARVLEEMKEFWEQ